MVDAEQALEQAEAHRTEWKEHVRDAAELFHEQEGELFSRSEAIQIVQDECEISEQVAAQTLSALVGDLVDPVIQLPVKGDRYVGVVEYNEYSGAYGYVHYDDVNGRARRVVCAQCVTEADTDREVTHATAGTGSFDPDASFNDLCGAIHEHYEDEHDVMPDDVETGASLLSGTTISGNTAWHAGNDGSGSNLAADTVDGLDGGELPTASEGDGSPSSTSIAYDPTNEELLITKDV